MTVLLSEDTQSLVDDGLLTASDFKFDWKTDKFDREEGEFIDLKLDWANPYVVSQHLTSKEQL